MYSFRIEYQDGNVRLIDVTAESLKDAWKIAVEWANDALANVERITLE